MDETAMGNDHQGKPPNFDIPSMTYPQPWKSLPGPPPVAPQPAPPSKRSTFIVATVIILIGLAVGVAVGFILRL